MKRLQYSRYGLSVCVAALLAGCGGSQGQFSPSGAMPQSGAPAVRSEQNQKTISTAATTNLFYVALGGEVDLFTSQGTSQGRIVVRSASVNGAKTTAGECADQTGDIFVTESFARPQAKGDIRGFAPGSTTPIARFSDLSGAPSACSVDPTTGNLAVTNSAGPGLGIASSALRTLLVYSHAAKPPTPFTDARMAHFSSVGYDSSGNLFVDGVDANNAFAFAELAKGSSSFKTITLNHSIISPGSVQFDGQFITVADRFSGVIYRFTIDGTAGTEVGSTSLGKRLGQTWIAGDEVVAAWTQTAGNQQATCPRTGCASGVSIWHYPAGGVSFQDLGNEPENATGVTISVAPAR